jgi:hypothetical protein
MPCWARIVGDVLDAEVAWIAATTSARTGRLPARRGDGARGRRAAGAADAWDVMVSDRSYSAPMTVEAALAEARACSGTQFAVTAVQALESLAERGDLMPTAARLHLPTL